MSLTGPAGAEWNYGDVWDAVARVRGDSAALVHGDRRVSWTDFDARADALASGLVERGARRGDRVVQYLYNSPEYLEVCYAAYKAGLAPVNTNYRYRAGELRYLWDNADAVAVVFHGAFSALVDEVRREVGVRDWLWVDDGSGPCPAWATPYEELAGASVAGPYVAPWGRSGQDVVMIYTGGTTGMPKGVMWAHHDMFQAFSTAGDPPEADLDLVLGRLGDPADAVGLPGSPLMHATGFMFAHSLLTQGGTVVTMPERSFDAVALLDTVDRERVRALAMVGDAFGQPMLAALDASPGRWDLSSVAMLVSAGVMWSDTTKAGLSAAMPSALLVDVLGSTEAHGLGTSVGTGSGTARFQLGTNAAVLTEDGRRAGPGEDGLLAVAGHLPLGYHKDPDKTARTFPVVDGVRYSVPGDWARVEADGSITLLGRGSLCINTGGEKVFPEEVEEALETHPAVRDTTVVGLPDDRLGQAVAAAVESSMERRSSPKS